MMSERYRLAALQVGVAGKERVGLRLGEREHDQRERLDLPSRLRTSIEDVEAERRRDLVVARPAGMDLPADGSELPLDRAVHVLVLGQVAGRVERDLGQPLLDLGELLIREQAGAVEPPGVLEARLAVVRQELGVVRVEKGPDRRVERAADAPRPERHGATPSTRYDASSARSSRADVPSLAAMKMVLSPASVPAIDGCAPSSIAWASADA